MNQKMLPAVALGITVLVLALLMLSRNPTSGGDPGHPAGAPASDPATPAPAARNADSERWPVAGELPEERLAVAASPAEVPGTVRGSFVDARGLPIVDVNVAVHPYSSIESFTTRSDAGGRFSLEVPLPNDPDDHWVRQLSAEKLGYRSLETGVAFGSMRQVDLGALQLLPGGDLHGRVVREDGLPAAAAIVRLLEVSPEVSAADPGGSSFLQSPGSGSGCMTDSSGLYTLRGSASGTWQVCAQMTDTYYVTSPVLRLEPGADLEVPDIVLIDLPEPLVIAGIVVGPDERPLEGGRILYRRPAARGILGSLATTKGGRFTIRAPREGERLSLLAVAPPDRPELQGDWEDAAGGDLSVVLRTRAAAMLELQVRDPDGLPVEEFGWIVETVQDGAVAPFDASPPAKHDGGRASIRSPEVDFKIRVDANGYEKATVDVDPSDSAPGPILVTLVPRPWVSGIVTLPGGEPVSHALVQLASVDRQEEVVRRPPPWRGKGITYVRTDFRGAFRVVALEAGVHRLGVSGKDIAPTTGDDLEVPASGGLEDVRIVIGASSRVWGSVLVPPGNQALGLEVELLRGGRRERSSAVQVDGTYAFEHLAPGHVALRIAAVPWEHPPGFPGPCAIADVVEGREARVDLDLREDSDQRIEGRIRLDGLSFDDEIVADCWHESTMLEADWVLEAFEEGSSELLASARVSGDGSFALHLAQPGSFRCRLSGDAGYQSRLVIERTLDVEGSSVEWNLDLETGCVLVHGGSMPLELLKDYYLVRRPTRLLPAAVTVLGRFGSDQTMVFAHVPAGPVRLCSGLSTGDEILVREAIVEAGSVLVLEVP